MPHHPTVRITHAETTLSPQKLSLQDTILAKHHFVTMSPDEWESHYRSEFVSSVPCDNPDQQLAIIARALLNDLRQADISVICLGVSCSDTTAIVR